MLSQTRSSLAQRYPQKKASVWILIAGSGLFLLVGLSVPLVHVTQMIFWKSSYSVLTGILNLIHEREIFLAGLIFIFSVIFPTVKLVALAALWGAWWPDSSRLKALHWLGILGKWSMLDVLIVAVMVILVKTTPLIKVEPRIGVYLFSVAIFCSMIASRTVERLAQKATNLSKTSKLK